MTYLQLLQALHRESGVAGSAPGSVTGLSGMPAKLAAWIVEAWLDIQASRKWTFLRAESDVSLTVGVQDYAVAALGLPVREFDTDWAASMQADGSDKQRLYWIAQEAFRDRYGLDDPQSERPSRVSLMNGVTLRFNTLPDSAYKVRLAYWKSATALATNGDTPTLADEDCRAIVWRALMMYAAHEGAGDVFADAQAKYQMAFARLCQRYLPAISLGGALA